MLQPSNSEEEYWTYKLMQEHFHCKPHPDPPLSSKVGILTEAASQRLALLLLLSQHIFVWKGDWYILLYDQLWFFLRIPASLIDKPIVHDISLRLAPLGTFFGFLPSLCHMPWLGLVCLLWAVWFCWSWRMCTVRYIFGCGHSLSWWSSRRTSVVPTSPSGPAPWGEHLRLFSFGQTYHHHHHPPLNHFHHLLLIID